MTPDEIRGEGARLASVLEALAVEAVGVVAWVSSAFEALDGVGPVLSRIRGDLSETAEEVRALLERVAVEYPAPVPPVPPVPPGGGAVLLKSIPLAVPPPAAAADRQKLFSAVGIPDGTTRAWVDESRSLVVPGNGDLRVVLDKARWTASPNSGGSSWVNAALPLSRPVAAARISYESTMAPWEWGTSGKLPGLMRWVEGRAPGGGEVTRRNWSIRPCWNDWNRDGTGIRFGPYVYGQELARGPVNEDVWPDSPNYANGTLRWWGPAIPRLDLVRMRAAPTLRVQMDVTPAGSGKSLIETTLTEPGGVTVSRTRYVMQLAAAGEPHEITHCTFVVMYGGDTLAYGPNLPVTEVLLRGFEVSEL